MSIRNIDLQTVLNELKAAGVPYQVRKSHHLKVVWWCRGQKRLLVVAHTSSDRKSILNNKTRVRRMLKQDGLAT